MRLPGLLGFLLLFLLASLSGPAVAQTADIVGRWQGGFPGARIVLMVRKDKAGAYAGEYYFIDNSPHPKPFTSANFKDNVFTFTDGPRSYRGVMSADGDHIKGTPFDLDRAPKTGAWPLPPDVPHTVQMVTVDDGVKLEVLDWGGSGPPLVFLAGLGEDAHVFDLFVSRFNPKHHIYGITHRGFGASDRPDPDKASYSAARLADDVLQVMAKLKLEKPVLAGWSFAGSELSGIGTRAPEKVAGLVYIDAGYPYAFYTPGTQTAPAYNLQIDLNDFREKLRQLSAPGVTPAQAVAQLDELLARNLPELKTDLEATRSDYQAMPQQQPAASPAPARPLSLDQRINRAIIEGQAKFTDLKAPVLALFALPSTEQPGASEAQLAYLKRIRAANDERASVFEAAHSNGRVVRIANAQHAMFNSNPDEVFREMDTFMDKLPH